jgi:hypothetical protein
MFIKEWKMALIEKPDFNSRKSIPVNMKLILLIAVIIGIWGRSCWRANERNNILFDDITLTEITSVSVEFSFIVDNQTFQSGEKPILIKILTNLDKPLATKITSVKVESNKKQKHYMIIDKFDRPLGKEESITNVSIELYQKSAF